MKLRYEMPEKIRPIVLEKIKEEELLYCVPYDVDEDNKFTEGWLIVTEKLLLCICNGKIEKEICIKEGANYKSEGLVGNGCLEAVVSGVPIVIARYSMTQLPRYMYIARALNDFSEKGNTVVTTDEEENRCPKCGRVYPEGSRTCYACVNKWAAVKKLWGVVKPYWALIAITTVIFWIIAGIRLIEPRIYRTLIDNYLTSKNAVLNGILLCVFGIVACQLSSTLFGIIQNRIMVSVGTKISKDLRAMVFAKIQSLSLRYLESKKPGDLMNRVTNDTGRLQDFLQNQITMGLNQIFSLIAVGIVLFIMNWKLALLIILPAPLVLIFCRLMWSRIHLMFSAQWRVYDKCNTILQDIISGIRVVKAFGQEEKEIKRFQDVSRLHANITGKNEKTWNTWFPSLGFIMGLGNFLVLYYGGKLVIGHQMQFGELIQFTQYAAIVYGPLNWLSFFPRMLADAMSAVERIFEVIDEEPDVKDYQKSKPHQIEGHVTLNNVTFGYHSYQPVLEGINLDVKTGEMIGLVGHSGAGKSTLINLIMRFYDVDEGAILIDGINIKDIRQQDLRSQIGVVLQESFLFSGTIMENIKYSKPDATLEEIIRAAKIANAHDFIMRFTDGYDTKVGEKGHRLSGGERQRIAIARAIIHDPKILILDEATASVDTETEQQIQEALGRLVKNRTTFAIAHRLSTLKNATRLLVVDKGRPAELGTHDELIRKKGIYYKLVMAQRQMTRMQGAAEAAASKKQDQSTA